MDEPLNLLALGLPSRSSRKLYTNLLTDGGGIRGVSMLLILDEIMKRIQYDKHLPNPPRPCEFFHLIGGTSTGGYVGTIMSKMLAVLNRSQPYRSDARSAKNDNRRRLESLQ